MSPRRSRTSWITPVRSRSASSARAEQPSTRSKIHNCYSNRQTVKIGGLPVLLYDAARAGHARPADFPARGCLFYSAGPHICGPYCMAPQGPAQVLGLTLPAAGAMHPGRNKYLPYKIISPRHNTVQRQVSGANLFYYRCSTLSLISAVRPWFQNWVPM